MSFAEKSDFVPTTRNVSSSSLTVAVNRTWESPTSRSVGDKDNEAGRV